MNLNIKNIPPYLKTIIYIVPSLILVILFIILIYIPKNDEIKKLTAIIVKLDNEIASSEVKVRKLDELKVENIRLKARLAELQEQLPEEKEVSPLLRQISDLGLKSGLEILLWRPETRKPDPAGLYVEIPVQVDVTGGYHDLGIFFSHISQIKRIVNLSNIKLESYTARSGAKIIKANFTASTFSAVTK
ncbi:MAG TPA: type 4a pilus biogenesis protein PilO [Thermodesulfovibrionia bacterium]|nr:type 4a pilus biogenesis protein PilO [Thermodesulfovibrionia bacterium]